MTRRLLLFVPLAACMGADPAQEVWDLVSQAATSLSERNPVEFIAAFDPAMPGYDKLRADVAALLAVAEAQSSIELVSDEGDGQRRIMELDWLLKIKPDNDATSSTRRQQRVKCRMEKAGKKWRIAAFEPLSLFAPPGA
jgi:hypothetical protein